MFVRRYSRPRSYRNKYTSKRKRELDGVLKDEENNLTVRGQVSDDTPVEDFPLIRVKWADIKTNGYYILLFVLLKAFTKAGGYI